MPARICAAAFQGHCANTQALDAPKSEGKSMSTRRTFLKQNSLVAAGAWAALSSPFAIKSAQAAPHQHRPSRIPLTANSAAAPKTASTCFAACLRRGYVRQEPLYAAAKAGTWTGTRDAIEWGHVAPQPLPSGNYDYTRAVQWATQPGGKRRRLPGFECLDSGPERRRQTRRYVFHSRRRLHHRHEPQSCVRRPRPCLAG